MGKAALYLETARHLGVGQVAARVWRGLGGKTRLSGWDGARPDPTKADASMPSALSELDFDPAFVRRFDLDALCAGRVELLHVAEEADWDSSDFWRAESQAPLWRFNLHYHEYLLPLAKAFLDTGERGYLAVAEGIVSGWIAANLQPAGGPGWDPYPISMRTVCWLALLAECGDDMDEEVVAQMETSLADQAAFLADHLETDILANHYLEGLKALALLGLHFKDDNLANSAVHALEGQVAEQILPDGMHFELSPMYQKVVLEDLLRVAVALRAARRSSEVIDRAVGRMCDAAWSMERGLVRTPLFNDAGDNVSKGLESLLACARKRLGIEPSFTSELADSGYEVIEASRLKLVFDCGRANPPHAMAHMHCDALSFELYTDGAPVVVNCGTYQYQGDLRNWFRSTGASSGVCVDGCEQHEMWSQFRVARYGQGGPVSREGDSATARFRDYLGHESERTVRLSAKGLAVTTSCKEGSVLTCRYHLNSGLSLLEADGGWRVPEVACSISVEGEDVTCRVEDTRRAPEFGLLGHGKTLVVKSGGTQQITFAFEEGGADERQ